MAIDRLLFQDIKSWTPSIDPRAIAEGTTFVLQGKNYVFDSKGPKAAFASRILNEGNQLETGLFNYTVWSHDGFIFTPTRIGSFSQNEYQFVTHKIFDTPITGGLVRTPWTRAQFGTTVYYCHRSLGIYKYDATTQTWSVFDPGILTPIAVCESNGRLIVLGIDVIAWSGPGNPEDFTPELGGAGAQDLVDRIGGRPVTLISLAYGYLVYTTRGALVGEFIGGDFVFRHYVSESRQTPLSSSAVAQLPDGSYVIGTRQGLYLQEFNGSIAPMTPVFNEYLREVILASGIAGYQIRLDYIIGEDRLYVQTRDWTNTFNRTYVLAIALDKWGEFSQRHFGIIQHGLVTQPTGSDAGYVDSNGRAHYFVPLGYSRETALGVFEGLDSEIVLGPLRSPALQPQVDSMQELQNLVIGHRSQPSWSQYEIEDLEDEPNEVFDEQIQDEEVEDQDSPHLALAITTYQIEIISDLSGFDWKHPEDVDSESEMVQTVVPELVEETGHAKYYSCLVPGIWHRIRLQALEPNEYFHVTFGELTLSYIGEQ